MIIVWIIFLIFSLFIDCMTFLPIHDPMNAIRKSTGMNLYISFPRNHSEKYIGIRVISTSNAIEAIVAIYRSFESQNIVKNAHRITHPVPMSPAKNPESAHQILPNAGVGTLCHVGRMSEKSAKNIKIIPSNILRSQVGKVLTRDAPTSVAMTLGRPKRIKILLSKYLKKRKRRVTFPKM